jgi:predicted metal-dependent HD superfamily phosphohydrolase
MKAKRDLLNRWNALAARTGLVGAGPIGAELLSCYAEPHRAYHTEVHLHAVVSCLELIGADDRLVLAAWFHDAIYQPGRSDNEARSAVFAWEQLSAAGLSAESAEFVKSAVLATSSHDPEKEEFAALIDADLAILGSPPRVYSQYCQGIRQEYDAIPLSAYARGRAAFLQSMLKRPHIFHLPWFRQRYESAARMNLGAELSNLAVPACTGAP